MADMEERGRRMLDRLEPEDMPNQARQTPRHDWSGLVRVVAVVLVTVAVTGCTGHVLASGADQVKDADPAAIAWRHDPTGTVVAHDAEGHYRGGVTYVVWVESDQAFPRNSYGEADAHELVEVAVGWGDGSGDGRGSARWRSIADGDRYEWSSSTGDVVMDQDGEAHDAAWVMALGLGIVAGILTAMVA